jgi:GT2 family glycosyltransferase
MATITAILVNYNTEALMRKALDCLYVAAGATPIKVVVVDNASRDGSVALLKTRYPQVTLIRNETNVGFGRANNVALDHMEGSFALLLNTDAFILPDALSKALDYMQAHPRCGILGAGLVGRDGAPQPSARFFPTPWNTFASRTGFSRLLPKVHLVDDPQWDRASPRECDWVPGCFFLVRREVIAQVGLFDPRFFLYFEEVDHCRRAKQAGWTVVCHPQATVVHLGGESAGQDGPLTVSGRQVEALQVESELLYFRKNHGLAGVLIHAALATATDALIVLKQLCRLRPPAALAACARHAVLVWKTLLRTRLGASSTR